MAAVRSAAEAASAGGAAPATATAPVLRPIGRHELVKGRIQTRGHVSLWVLREERVTKFKAALYTLAQGSACGISWNEPAMWRVRPHAAPSFRPTLVLRRFASAPDIVRYEASLQLIYQHAAKGPCAAREDQHPIRAFEYVHVTNGSW